MSLIQALHVIALIVLVAVVGTIDLRVLGLTQRGCALADVVSSVDPYLRGSLVLVVVTGGLDFMSQPVKYGHSIAFLLAWLLFGAAFAVHLTIVRKVTGAAELATVRFRKLAAYLSLALWLGVVIADRGVVGRL